MHRARSDRWDRQAQTSWALASDAKDDLDRWYALMRFHRFARRAEIDHRLHAGSLLGPVPANTAPPEFEHPPEYLTVPVEAAQPTLSLSQRLELAEIT